METLSVIVPLSHRPEEARAALDSIDASAAFLRAQPEGRGVAVEVVVVDRGSDNDTRALLEERARGRPDYHLLFRGGAGNRSSAFNLGVALTAGDPLFFLDGDGLFLEGHLHDCLMVLQSHEDVDFVKSPIELSDPVHPHWVAKISNSLVANVAVRRRVHERVGGFPDQHVFRRVGARYEHDLDIFHSIEDVFYNMKLAALAHGRMLTHPSVRHLRRPGNAFDRQYDRFQSEPGQVRHDADELYELRVHLAKALIDREIAEIRRSMNPFDVHRR